jgi:hypothetical protein
LFHCVGGAAALFLGAPALRAQNTTPATTPVTTSITSTTALLSGRPFTPANLNFDGYSRALLPLAQAGVGLVNNRWYVKFGDAGPLLPLLASGNTAPIILAVVPLSLITALGVPPVSLSDVEASLQQLSSWNAAPIVVVYRAGTVSGPDAGGGTLTVERAVLFHPLTGKPLGDALWAVRPPAGAAPMPQPAWRCNGVKLTVENPYEKTIQEIPLAPPAGTN